MLQVPAAATVGTTESRCLTPQTGAPSIVQAVPQLLDPEQGVADGSSLSR